MPKTKSKPNAKRVKSHNLKLLKLLKSNKIATLVVMGMVMAVLATSGIVREQDTQAAHLTGLKVNGNKIVNEAGHTVRLVGVNDAGLEYACVQGWGFYDGPATDASVKAMANWKSNVVRLPLNESCWLNINGSPAAYSGAAYKTAIQNYVTHLTNNGFAVILDLHFAAPGTNLATNQWPMPNRDHTPEFWRQVATAYKGQSNVMFDLYNEPYPDNNSISNEAWRCWRDGGTCNGINYQAAGMQELVNAVRSTGATNIVLLGGVNYAGTVSQFLTYKPNDPLNNMAVSAHIYNFSRCTTASCWNAEMGPVMDKLPLIMGEFGPDEIGSVSECKLGTTGFSNNLMNWLDSKNSHYVAWVWETWNYCRALITNHNGTPTAWGTQYKNRLASLNLAPVPPPTTTDATPPTVSISQPTNGATVSGSISVAMSATDNVGVTKVELFVNGSLRGNDITSPFAVTLDTTSVSNGSHTLQAKAYDAAGNTATSPNITIIVSNTTTAQLPDVVVTSLSMSPAAPKAGEQVVFTAVIKNQGPVSTPIGADVGVGFFVNGVQANWGSGGPLAARATRTVTATNSIPHPGVPYWTAVAGTHTAMAFVDDVDRFAESNETNNKLTQSFTVPGTATGNGDANNDGRVNAIDLSIVISRDGQNFLAADFNNDGVVGAADMAILLGKWTW